MSKIERCPKGTRRNRKTKICEEKPSIKEKKRCPKGTRRNRKTKICEEKLVSVVQSVNDVCSICLGVIDDDKYKTECNHTFHTKCLGVWCGRLPDGKKTCPYCREKIVVDCKKIEPIVSSNIFPYLNKLFYEADHNRNAKKAEQDNNRVIYHFLGDPLFDPNIQQHTDGRTPLMVALYYRKCAIAEKLMKLPGINVNIVDNDNKSALHYAVANNGRCKDVIELLLKHPDINTDIKDFTRSENAATALHVALKDKNFTAINLFKKYKKVPKALKQLL